MGASVCTQLSYARNDAGKAFLLHSVGSALPDALLNVGMVAGWVPVPPGQSVLLGRQHVSEQLRAAWAAGSSSKIYVQDMTEKVRRAGRSVRLVDWFGLCHPGLSRRSCSM